MSPEPVDAPAPSLRRRVYEIFAPRLGGRAGVVCDWFIMGLIAANLVAVTVETVDVVDAAVGAYLTAFEVVSVAIFTVEYAARLWSAVEDPSYRHRTLGRLRFAGRPLMLIDLLAIAPFYLALVGVGADLRFLRALRLLRLFRLFKLVRYSSAMQTFATVFAERKEKLVVAVAVNALLLLIASSVMYHVERAGGSAAFASIPDAMWWGIATLARLPPAAGYEGGVPETIAGQATGAVVAVLGIGLFALPASILASGFVEAAERRRHALTCPECGAELQGSGTQPGRDES